MRSHGKKLRGLAESTVADCTSHLFAEFFVAASRKSASRHRGILLRGIAEFGFAEFLHLLPRGLLASSRNSFLHSNLISTPRRLGPVLLPFAPSLSRRANGGESAFALSWMKMHGTEWRL